MQLFRQPTLAVLDRNNTDLSWLENSDVLSTQGFPFALWNAVHYLLHRGIITTLMGHLGRDYSILIVHAYWKRQRHCVYVHVCLKETTE